MLHLIYHQGLLRITW